MTNLNGRGVLLFGITLPTRGDPNGRLAKQLAELDEVGGTLILVFVGLHVLDALYHHFWRRDGRPGLNMIGSRARAEAGLARADWD